MPVTLTCPRCLNGLDDHPTDHPFIYPTHVRIVKSRATHLFKDGEVRRVVKWEKDLPYIDVSPLLQLNGFCLLYSTWVPATAEEAR